MDIYKNDRADELTKLAATSFYMEICFHRRNVVLERMLRNKYCILWQDRWNDSLKGRMLRNFVNTVTEKMIL